MITLDYNHHLGNLVLKCFSYFLILHAIFSCVKTQPVSRRNNSILGPVYDVYFFDYLYIGLSR